MRQRLLLLSFCALGALPLAAQQQQMFTQYMYNEVAINPAYAGSHDAVSLTALYRKQWVGISGAPETFSFSAHTPLADQRLGAGLVAMYDELGPTRNLNLYGSFAYRLMLDPEAKRNLQFGIQAGITSTSTDFADLSVRQPGDPAFSENVQSAIMPNVGAGFYYFTERFAAGISAPQLVNQDFSVGDFQVAKQRRHYFGTAGYLFTLNQNWKLRPTTFVKFVDGAPLQFDFTGMVGYRDLIWAGLAWRSFDSFDALVMLQANDQLRIGYSYDLSTTALQEVNSGSHEIMVNYRLRPARGKMVTPRYF